MKFLFFSLNFSFSYLQSEKFLYKRLLLIEEQRGMNKKIHEAIAFTAIAPLLNLNLNYEKLQCKDTDYLLFRKLNHTNFCIFQE